MIKKIMLKTQKKVKQKEIEKPALNTVSKLFQMTNDYVDFCVENNSNGNWEPDIYDEFHDVQIFVEMEFQKMTKITSDKT